MSTVNTRLAARWSRIGTDLLPFADVASRDLPLSRLLRLSLFQVSVGMASVLLTGTLNRVMIVELHVPAWLVAMMVSLPLLFAPLRALIGFKSDNHRSRLGWRRVPYIWFGTLMQFGGFAILPFALLIMSGDTTGPKWIGTFAAALGFLFVGAGMHTVQTAGLALATDIATPEARPRVVALLYVMLLVGMMFSALAIGAALADFSALRLVKVVQGVAALTMLLNLTALWKQEGRDARATAIETPRPDFSASWADFIGQGRTRRLLVATGLGAAAFAMQDVLLEPYGGQILRMSVGATTSLTALWAAGTLAGFGIAARQLARGADMHRLAGYGAVAGIAAFMAVIFAAPFGSEALLCIGVAGIGLGGGLFSVGTLIAAMALSEHGQSGLALGAWGAVQATCAGLAIAVGGLVRDGVSQLAMQGALGPALAVPVTGYGLVYMIEIVLLFATLVAIGPLARRSGNTAPVTRMPFGLTEFPT